MHMNIYWALVIFLVVIGLLMPDDGPGRLYYTIIATTASIVVCACRYEFLSGDLIKYNTIFRHLQDEGYFSDEAINEWRNTGFYWLMKFVGHLTRGNFQAFLFILGTFCCLITGIFIYRYSVKPWFSFFVWNCMTFFVLYDFISIKQGLAMTILQIALMYLFEDRILPFVLLTLLAGFVHMPAFLFLLVLLVYDKEFNERMLFVYCLSMVFIYLFRGRIVNFFGEAYYEEGNFVSSGGGIGGRTIVILLMVLTGFLLKGFQEKRFNTLFHITIIAMILQTFSNYDNVFTRFADYFLQFTILYIPDLFYPDMTSDYDDEIGPPMVYFTDQSMRIMVLVLCVILVWWYNTTFLGVSIKDEIDNYLNYKFFWQVDTII